MFVRQATTVQRAAVPPHLARLVFTKIRLEEKANMTANHALLVIKMLIHKTDISDDILTVWMSLPGWFQDLPGQNECNPCPPGFHCQPLNPSPTRGSSAGVSSPLPCPAGYFCPKEESPHNQPLACPKGSYSPLQGLTSAGKIPELLQEIETSAVMLHSWLVVVFI